MNISRAKTAEPAGLVRIIEPMSTTVRIVTYPDPVNGTGFCAAVLRTTASGWARGGTTHANDAKRAEQDARRWLLHGDEDDRVLVLPVHNTLTVLNRKALARMLDATLEPGLGTGMIAA
jgi:hypothetical protein